MQNAFYDIKTSFLPYHRLTASNDEEPHNTEIEERITEEERKMAEVKKSIDKCDERLQAMEAEARQQEGENMQHLKHSVQKVDNLQSQLADRSEHMAYLTAELRHQHCRTSSSTELTTKDKKKKKKPPLTSFVPTPPKTPPSTTPKRRIVGRFLHAPRCNVRSSQDNERRGSISPDMVSSAKSVPRVRTPGDGEESNSEKSVKTLHKRSVPKSKSDMSFGLSSLQPLPPIISRDKHVAAVKSNTVAGVNKKDP